MKIEPFHFGPRSSPLFGLHHLPGPGKEREHTAVICPPVGQEYIRSHRSLVQLSLRLARAGHHVLRFDYTGCGDSADGRASHGLDRWEEDVRLAVEESRTRSGARRVTLVGVRLGSTLALRAGADDAEVAGFALWAPVLDGRAYLGEQLEMQRHLHRFAYVSVDGPVPAAAEDLDEVLGFPLSNRLREELRADDLLVGCLVPKAEFLVLDPEGGSGWERVGDRFPSEAMDVRPGAGSTERVWRSEPFQTLVPVDVLRRIVDWCDRFPS